MHGARAVHQTIVDLPTTVVWIPMLDGDELPAAVTASALYRDRAAPQFWDGSKLLGKEVARSLGVPDWTAWDIYLFYPPGATWTAAGLPRPAMMLAQAFGTVIALPDTLPAAPDQSAVPERFAGRIVVVGEQTHLEALLAKAEADLKTRMPVIKR